MAENMIKFLRGNVASLPQTATAGAVYFTKDEGLYLGLEDGSYHRYGDFITVADVASLPETGAHETCMYYCESENVLAKWDGAKWVQINKQKTLAELGGVAKSVYEAKMTALEQADTDNSTAISELEDYVGTIPTDEKYADIKTIVGYVNKKAEETLASAQGGSSETAASVKAALDTYKTENDAAVKANADDIADILKDYLKAADKEELQGNIDLKAAQADLDNAEDRITALENANKADGAVGTAISEAQAAADAAQADVDALAGKVGTVAEGKTVVDLIGEAQAQADKGVADAATAQGAADAAQDAVDALAEKVGEVEDGKTVVDMIAEAQAAATYDDTQIKKDIKDNSDAIAAEQERAEGVEEGLQNQINLIMNNPDTKDVIDSIAEFTQYVADHGTIAEGFRTDIDKNKEDIAAIAGDYLKKADKEALQDGIDAVAGRMDTAEGEIDALQADSHTHGNATVLNGITAEKVAAWDAAEANAEAHADGLNSAMDTRVQALEAIDHDHANKAELDLIVSGDKAKWDAAAAKAHTHTFVESELNLIQAGDVAKWNAAQANAEATAASALASAKSELEGKITSAQSAAEAHADTKVQALADGAVAANATEIAKKANSADVYDKTETFNKDEINALLTWGSF